MLPAFVILFNIVVSLTCTFSSLLNFYLSGYCFTQSSKGQIQKTQRNFAALRSLSAFA